MTRLHDLVMASVSTVDWPDSARIRARVRRRRAARVVGGGLAVVLVVATLAWASGPMWTDAEPRPANSQPIDQPPHPDRPAPELLRTEDVGPGYDVHAWSSYGSTVGGTRREDYVLLWPPTTLDGCPARMVRASETVRVPYGPNPKSPDAIQHHEGGVGVRADPEPGNFDGVSVEEVLLRFTDVAAAQRVLDEARQTAVDCASFTAGRARYTLAVSAEGFAGVDSVQVDVTEEPATASTGKPATHAFLFVRLGSMVMLVTPTLQADPAWLRDIARTAVVRYCAVSGTC
ncbi:hypothetical protein [Virgisporangium aurantiacum]|uniref:PknH-like extracellular domain-containing protein n=1 Tax=Virgisporangium aurantiacum TaxID=175570 RepID=A0A8J3ZAH5_9ACTN|nr:hypothetical protein [Virgisporangium aurantiacum]GIJ60376.1 hypothetical protein Vau01_078920 [Virgisporangium aurantiacum]